MPSYYIDPERCFEVPFRIPLPDRDEMATRLANIRLIMKNARERQSLSSAKHQRMLSTRPIKYRGKAKAIMDSGRLKRFVGDLTQQYFDYLGFHQENQSDMSPLIIQVPALCSPLSPPSPCLLYVTFFNSWDGLHEFPLAVLQDWATSTKSSGAISRGHNSLLLCLLGGERDFSTIDDGNVVSNPAPGMNIQMGSERRSMLL